MDKGRRGALYELGQNYEALQKELRRTEVVLAAVRSGAAEREAKIAILAEAAAKRTEEANAANARIAEVESQLAERTAQLREVQGNWKKYEPFVSRMQEAEAKAADWKAAHERAAVIASEALDKQRAEYEARLAEAKKVSDDWQHSCIRASQAGEAYRLYAVNLRAVLEGAEFENLDLLATKPIELARRVGETAAARIKGLRAALEQIAKWAALAEQGRTGMTLMSQIGLIQHAAQAALKGEWEGKGNTDKQRLDFLSCHMKQIHLDFRLPKGEAFLFSGKKTLREVIDIEMAHRQAVEKEATPGSGAEG